jgi:hypothetical protein
MADIVLDRFLVNSNEANNKISDFIENKDEYFADIYKVLSTIPNNYILQYFFIAICIYAFFKDRIIRLNDILVFLICIVLIYFLSKRNYSNFFKFTQNKSNELKFLNKIMFDGIKTIKGEIGDFNTYDISNANLKKSYLYYSPLIISLMYNLKSFIQFNIQAYSSCLFNINDFLKICYQANFLTDSLVDNYESLIILKNSALNELSTLIYSIHTSTVTYNKLDDSVNLLHELLNRHIDVVSKLFQDRVSYNINSDSYVPLDVFEKHIRVKPNDMKTNNYQPSYNLY